MGDCNLIIMGSERGGEHITITGTASEFRTRSNLTFFFFLVSYSSRAVFMKFSFSFISLFISFFIFLYVRLFYFLLESWFRIYFWLTPVRALITIRFPPVFLFSSIEPFIIVFNPIHYSDSILWQWIREELNRDPTNCKTLFCFCWNRVKFSENWVPRHYP